MAYDEERGVTVYFGGELSNPGDDPTYYNDTWEYDGLRWRPVAIAGEVPAPRSGHAMTYDAARKQVVMLGGVNEDGYLREFWAYEPLGGGAGRWLRLPMWVEGSAPGPWTDGSNDEARAGHAMAYDRKYGRVLVAGGTSGPNSNWDAPGTWRSSDIEIWDGVRWGLSMTIAQPIAGSWNGPTRHAMAYDPDQHRLAICGGAYYLDQTADNPSDWRDLTDNRFLTTAPSTNFGFSSFRFQSHFEIAPFPGGRQQHAMVYDEQRRRFVIYGGTGDGSPPIGEDHYEAWAITAADGIVRYAHEALALVPRPPSRARHAMVYDRKRRVTVLVGGVGGVRYDDTWELGQVAPAILNQPTDFNTGPCQAGSFRVQAQGQGTLQYQWRRDGRALEEGPRHRGTRTPWLQIEGVRHGDAGGYDVIVLDACGPELAVTSRVARLTVEPGLQWVKREIPGPPPRADAAMAYDEARGVMVLFGGYTYTDGVWQQLNDLWEYDGARWELRHPSLPDNGLLWDPASGVVHQNWPGPGTRFRHRLAYDPARRVSLLFGGRYLESAVSAVQLDDLWSWDGRSWWRLLPGVGAEWPSARERHAMAWDNARGRLVLFGGFPAGDRRDVVWEWNGRNWTTVPFSAGQNTSISHDGASMVWDELDGRIVSGPYVSGAGGRAASFFLWDGTSWTIGPEAVSVPRFDGDPPLPIADYAAMAFDRNRRRAIYFGGYFGGLSGATFQLEPAGWVVADAGTGPSPRSGHVLAYDARRQVAVLFGGATDMMAVSGETWELVGVDLPYIEQHPVDRSTEAGGTVAFGVVAKGGGDLQYQWLRDGVALQDDGRVVGSRSATLTIAEVGPADTAIYLARVANACGSTDSAPGRLSVAGAVLVLQTRRAAQGVSLEWTHPAARVEEARDPSGPWKVVPGATSPYRPALLNETAFFRLRLPPPLP